MPDIRSEEFLKMAAGGREFYDIGRDNRCVLRDEAFVERAPRPSTMAVLSIDDAIPELSSFRPIDPDAQDQPGPVTPQSRLKRGFTSPVDIGSPEAPDTPAWMRPLHLIDVGNKSIYKNIHDDGPIRHALCLSCYRTRGKFCKVRRHGYESCGGVEVLDSHYWEDETWPEENSDEASSDEANSSESQC